MIFKQPVKPIEIEKTSKQRRLDLEIIELDLYEPRFMTREELIEYNVQPDFNAGEYFEQLNQNKDIDKDEYAIRSFIEKFFSHYDTYDCHSYENTIDHIAIRLNRGDAVLSISALKLIKEGIGIVNHDNQIKVICAKGSCIALINQVWIGGDAIGNLFIDFRGDAPIFINSGIEDWIDGIATLPDGTTEGIEGRPFYFYIWQNICQAMAENDTSRFQEDKSWQKTTRHRNLERS